MIADPARSRYTLTAHPVRRSVRLKKGKGGEAEYAQAKLARRLTVRHLVQKK